MLYKEMLNYIDSKPNAIDFLHHSEHAFFSQYEIESKGLAYSNLIMKICNLYESKKLTNKQASKLILTAYNANPLSL